jgi:hypothetical protein
MANVANIPQQYRHPLFACAFASLAISMWVGCSVPRTRCECQRVWNIHPASCRTSSVSMSTIDSTTVISSEPKVALPTVPADPIEASTDGGDASQWGAEEQAPVIVTPPPASILETPEGQAQHDATPPADELDQGFENSAPAGAEGSPSDNGAGLQSPPIAPADPAATDPAAADPAATDPAATDPAATDPAADDDGALEELPSNDLPENQVPAVPARGPIRLNNIEEKTAYFDVNGPRIPLHLVSDVRPNPFSQSAPHATPIGTDPAPQPPGVSTTPDAWTTEVFQRSRQQWTSPRYKDANKWWEGYSW